MKNIITPIVLFLTSLCISQKAKSQKSDKGQLRLAQLLIKEPKYSCVTLSKALYVIDTVCEIYKVNKIRFVKNTTKSSHFNPLGRVMNLHVKDSSNMSRPFINELSHAAQFAKNPIWTSLSFLKSFPRTFVNSFFLTKEEKVKAKLLRKDGCVGIVARFWVAHERWEFVPESAENIAHKVIQPKIIQQLDSLLFCNQRISSR